MMLCGTSFGWRTLLDSSLCRLHLKSGFMYSCILFAISPHKEYVLSDTLEIIGVVFCNIHIRVTNESFLYLNICLSFSEFPMKVPCWQLCTWSWRVNKKNSLNWNLYGYCCNSWYVASMNCVKIGANSLLSQMTWPQRLLNLCPNDNQSFSINAWKKLNCIHKVRKTKQLVH